ncbi:MAG: glycyl-radical enzyme activating protein [Clostridia bacterium]|nr:glycyl-radical enzyme activating protein [Clostridia bacterium]
MRVADIQRFCTHDGPGLRTTVFFKGCPLRCVWCHNPETQKFESEMMLHTALCAGCGACVEICPAGAQILTQTDRYRKVELCVGCGACAGACPTEACRAVGREMTPEQVADAVCEDAVFYATEGGVTLSGGEPLCTDGIEQLVPLLKKRGLHVLVETAGACESARLARVAPYVDEFYFDIKHTDPQKHRELTGALPDAILHNLALLDSLGARIRLRCLLVNGLTTEKEHFERVAALYHSLVHCTGVQLLRYHPMGGSKAAALGLADSGRREWIPTEEQIRRAAQILTEHKVPIFL